MRGNRQSAWLLGGTLLFLASVAVRADDTTPVRFADQGWNLEQARTWSYGTQGSRLLPLSWFRALEQPASEDPFASPGFLERFGYIRAPVEFQTALPIGFAVDAQRDNHLKNTRLRWFRGQADREEWLGFTCAACHTGMIETGSNRVLIQGAPGMGDFQSFVGAINLSLRQTAEDAGRFDRFAAKVLAGRDNADNRRRLRTALRQLLAYQTEVARINQVPNAYGYARVDAFGYIFNKTLQSANANPVSGNPPTAPVSYPFLWDIHTHTRIQWNGIANNRQIRLPGGGEIDVGALGRNTGEVVGVFGEVVSRSPGLTRLPDYDSSVRVENLNLIENVLTRLGPPRWQDVFGSAPATAALIQRGADLFSANCKGCHRSRSAPVPGQTVEKMIPLATMLASGDLTDTRMACNAWAYAGPTGRLRGTRINPTASARHGAQSSVAGLLTTLVSGALLDQTPHVAAAALDNVFRPGKLPVVEGGLESVSPAPPNLPEFAAGDAECISVESNAYKARPLEGVFATAPYLHNGSVPTLYHLLLPAGLRPDTFWVGSRRFDATHVGFEWREADPARAFQFRTHDEQGRPIPGNANAGHEYGVDRLSEDDRWALIAYLKTL
jgi:mono/diheme cytochrome c family protein